MHNNHYCVISRDVNIREFYFLIREFQISRLVEYSKLNIAVWHGRLRTSECCNTVDNAAQLWLGWTDGQTGHPRLITCCVMTDEPGMKNKQPKSKSLGEVGPCVQFSGGNSRRR